MPLERPTFRVRNRSVLPAVGLLALYAALASGFVVATWRGEAGSRVLAESQVALPAVPLAICACPDPADRPQGRP